MEIHSLQAFLYTYRLFYRDLPHKEFSDFLRYYFVEIVQSYKILH